MSNKENIDLVSLNNKFKKSGEWFFNEGIQYSINAIANFSHQILLNF